MFRACDVYRNLNRKCVSIRVAGKVVAHPDIVAVYDVEFRVQRGACATVKQRGVRAVCAYARGDAEALESCPDLTGAVPVHFNPLRGDAFHTDAGRTVLGCRVLIMTSPTGAFAFDPLYG